MALLMFLLFALFVHGSLGDIVCEELEVGMCAYSVASSGNRCSLETYASNEGIIGYECKTSGVVANINMAEWIETDECINACGADRKSVGISSDSLLEPKFTSKLCSKECYQNCPNMLDLFYNLALGEGVYLPAFCKGKQVNGRREMSQLKSSATAWGPVSSANGRQLAEGPAVGVGFAYWAPAPLASASALTLADKNDWAQAPSPSSDSTVIPADTWASVWAPAPASL